MDDLHTFPGRVKKLSVTEIQYEPRSVLYVMSRDQRVHDNHALLAAQNHALQLSVPVVVAFIVYPEVGDRSLEQVTMMLDSLSELSNCLQSDFNIPFNIKFGTIKSELPKLVDELQPGGVYFDFNPLRGPRKAQQNFAEQALCPVFVVDTHNLVPVWVASPKQEIGARTLRPKIHRLLVEYLVEPDTLQKQQKPAHILFSNLSDFKRAKSEIGPNFKPNNVNYDFVLGPAEAEKTLNSFIKYRLRGYATGRNDPSKDHLSQLSPYLHFGNISSLRVLLAVYDAVQKDSSLQPDADVLIEEMIVRKELSDNFCYYNDRYDSLQGAPEWAQKTLADHADDPREFVYTLEQLEQALTHDSAWNAAQKQLTISGKIHGYMRMYWAKKVLEWSPTPKEALQTLIYLNDFYSIDGGDPNGYVGILWSVAGLHDRPWGQRPVYGTVRSMVYNGLKRKFDIEAYENQWLA